jgi:5-methylcytosine-specific restriction endonuclease McrA
MATKKAQRAYQLKWLHARRLAWIEANGPCKNCGSIENLEVDHINPETKRMEPSAIWSCSAKKRMSELKKCQVLCEDCHEEKTAKWHADQRKHGTLPMYDNGCRCRECKDTKNASVNEWRWATGRRKRARSHGNNKMTRN